MTTALTTTSGAPTDLAQLKELGTLLARSRFFKEDENAAITKILLGRELGVSPMAAMMEIHVIEGKPSVGSHLIAKGIKRSGKYDYKILDHTDQACRIQFFERLPGGGKEELGVFEYTIADAKRAGLAGKKNWTTSPKGMLFARAIGQGYRVHCPDALDVLCYADGELEPEEKEATPPDAVTVEHRPAPADGKPAARARVLQGGKPQAAEAFPGKVVDVVGTARPTTTTSSPSGGPTSSPSAPTSSTIAAPAPAAVAPASPDPAAPAVSSGGDAGPLQAQVDSPPGQSSTATPTGESAPRRRARRD